MAPVAPYRTVASAWPRTWWSCLTVVRHGRFRISLTSLAPRSLGPRRACRAARSRSLSSRDSADDDVGFFSHSSVASVPFACGTKLLVTATSCRRYERSSASLLTTMSPPPAPTPSCGVEFFFLWPSHFLRAPRGCMFRCL